MHGGLGACSPRKLDALTLLLRPFWDRSRAAVVNWLAKILHQILAKPADNEFPCTRESITVADKQVGCQMVKQYVENTSEQHQTYSMQDVYWIIYCTFFLVFSERMYDFRLLVAALDTVVPVLWSNCGMPFTRAYHIYRYSCLCAGNTVYRLPNNWTPQDVQKVDFMLWISQVACSAHVCGIISGQYKDGTDGSRDFRSVSASFLILRKRYWYCSCF